MQKAKRVITLLIVFTMSVVLPSLSQTKIDKRKLTAMVEEAAQKLQANAPDSARAVITLLEAYADALGNSRTRRMAEEVCDPWTPLTQLSVLYTALNDDKEQAFASFIRSYYKKNSQFKRYFYAMTPVFQFYQMRQAKDSVVQIAQELHDEAVRIDEKSLVLSACKYMKAWAAMAKGLQFETMQWMEEAYIVGKPVAQEEHGTPAFNLYLEMLGNLAQGYAMRGSFHKSLDILDEAEPMVVEQYGEQSQQCLGILMMKAEVIYRLLRVPELKAVVDRIELICDKETNINPQMLSQARAGLANLRKMAGDSLSKDDDISQNEGLALQQEVATALQNGQKDAAVAALNRLLRLTESHPVLDVPLYSNYIKQLVNIYLSSQEYNKALECLKKAESHIETHTQMDPYPTRSLEALQGVVLATIADYQGALQHLNKAKYMYDCAGDHSMSYYQECLGSLVEVCVATGDMAYAKLFLDEIEELYLQNISSEEMDASPELSAMQFFFSNVYVLLGYEAKAVEQFEKMFSSHGEHFTSPQWDYTKLLLFMTLGKKGEWAKAEQAVLSIDGSQDYRMQQYKQMALLVCQASQRKAEVTVTLSNFSQTVRNNVTAVMNTFSPLERQIFWENQAYYLTYGNNITLHFLPEDTLVAERCYDNALYVKSMQDKALHECPRWQDVGAALSPNEVAIEFVMVPSNFDDLTAMHYGALVLRSHQQSPRFIDLCEASRIDSLFMDVYHTDTAFVNRLYSPGYSRLYEAVWKPLEKVVRPGDRIYYSPIGHLNRINLEAVCMKSGTRIGEQYSLRQLSTTADIRSLKGQSWAFPPQAAVYGGIKYYESSDEMATAAEPYMQKDTDNDMIAQRSVYSSARGALQDELAGTLEEALHINDVMKKKGCLVRLLTDKKANEESVKDMTGQAPYLIHLGTHGFLLSTNQDQLSRRSLFEQSDFKRDQQQAQMLQSGLLMAGAYRVWNNEPIPAGVEDGILTSYEVSKLDLSKCQLVVLSACETGLGFSSISTGDVGMKRALKLAGVSSIMVSLWEVDDDATALLMQHFYDSLAEGLSPAKALENARNIVRKQYLQPYYWAPFVLVDALD